MTLDSSETGIRSTTFDERKRSCFRVMDGMSPNIDVRERFARGRGLLEDRRVGDSH